MGAQSRTQSERALTVTDAIEVVRWRWGTDIAVAEETAGVARRGSSAAIIQLCVLNFVRIRPTIGHQSGKSSGPLFTYDASLPRGG